MIGKIKNAFPHIIENDCLSQCHNKHVFVFEDNHLGKGVFVTDMDKRNLHIENNTNLEFYFLQNDNCLMANKNGKQCDYVVFNNSKFHFVEVKTAQRRILNYKTKTKSYSQIENTFKYYSERISFSDEIYLIGLVCISKSNKIIQTSKSTRRKEFKTKYRIDLQEGNYISFE